MNPADRYALIASLFSEAAELNAADRERWLQARSADASILEEVRQMLEAHDQTESGLLDHPIFDRSATSDDASLDDPMLDRTIGPWRIVGVLGEGGMGIVYAAERNDGLFERTVALKLLRPGSDARGLARRLESERKILGRLEHEGIARLYDGGVSDGLPYLAIELVDGDAITTWADNNRLDTTARVRLFLQVCDAVAYAHRSLVVHRDIKPSNIMVTRTSNGAPLAKLLDFGIAKVLEDDDASGLTRVASGALTPSYAAPEQFRGEPVTTATDVYSLGVVLYELLTGKRPYELGQLTASQRERVVEETVPSTPEEAAAPGRARQVAPDLSLICLRALAKEPERRYASADALAEDLRDYLDGLPVKARPDSVAYRTSRFVRRHRIAVAVASVVLLLSAFYAFQITAERNRAREAASEAREAADRAEAVAGFLEQILRAPNSRWYNESEATGPDTPIRAVLAEAAARVDRDFADRPDLRADLHHILGDTYVSLGLTEEARVHHLTVIRLRDSLYTRPHPKIAEALYYGGWYLADGDYLKSVEILETAVDMQRQRNEGNNFPFMIQTLSNAYMLFGRFAEADSILHEAVRFVEDEFIPGHDGFRYRDAISAGLAQDLVKANVALGRIDEARRWLAYSDSTVGLLPREKRYVMVWQRLQCASARVSLAELRFEQSEREALECLGVESSKTASRPFPGSLIANVEYPGQMEEVLVELYDAWGRPDSADVYREAAAAFVARNDSLQSRDRDRDLRSRNRGR